MIKKWCYILLLCATAVAAYGDKGVTSDDLNTQWKEIARQPGACSFVTPKGWRYVDPTSLPRDVKVMVKGKGKRELPPTINLAIEHVSCSQNEYLEVARKIHESNPQSSWSDLGMINTRAGPANIWQVDIKTNWGEVRLLQEMIVRNGKAYILTAGALRNEFSTYRTDFMEALKSLTINKNMFDLIENRDKRERFHTAYTELQTNFSALLKEEEVKDKTAPPEVLVNRAFNDSTFHTKEWEPFVELVKNEYGEMGEDWQKFVIKEACDQMDQAG